MQTYSCSSEVQFNDQSQSGDRDGEIAMKKLLLATVGLLALGMGAPASAADMAVKAAPPPIVAPIYSWAGFYIGANGGWGTSHKCWDVTNFLSLGPPPSVKVVTMRTAERWAVRSDTAGRPAIGCSV